MQNLLDDLTEILQADQSFISDGGDSQERDDRGRAEHGYAPTGPADEVARLSCPPKTGH